MDRKWILHWIFDLVSIDTIKKHPYFESWMWCPERYSKEELSLMKEFWEFRYICS